MLSVLQTCVFIDFKLLLHTGAVFTVGRCSICKDLVSVFLYGNFSVYIWKLYFISQNTVYNNLVTEIKCTAQASFQLQHIKLPVNHLLGTFKQTHRWSNGQCRFSAVDGAVRYGEASDRPD